jgi:microcystin-dependent protein
MPAVIYDFRPETRMKAADLLQSESDRRSQSTITAAIALWLKFLAAVLIFLTGMVVPAGTYPAHAQSGDALFIDQQGNVGIGRQAPQAKLDVNGAILGIGMVPPGAVVMFAGDINQAFDTEGAGRKGTPYEGWQLCNGKNGAPDLQDRFVAAAGRNYKIGDAGGADSIILTADQLPPHVHTGQTAAAGIHQHLIEGTDAKGLAKRRRRIPGQTTVDMGFGGGSNADPNDVRWRGLVNTDRAGNHSHSFTTGPAGQGQPHENRPSFYALAFIMRLP